MNKVREINIETDDLEYGRALARSIGVHYKGIRANVTGSEEPGDYLCVNGKRIYKYMSVHAIVQEIEAELPERAQLLQEKLSIGIVGMRGGCGVSSIAEGLARTFTLFHGRRVLLVTFSNFGPEYFSATLKPIDRLMYESEVLNDAEFEERIPGYVMPDEYGVWQLGLRKGYNPLSVENAAKINKLIEKLIAKLNINLTIFDFGAASAMGPEQMKLLSKTDISFAVLGSPKDSERVEKFTKIINIISGNGGKENAGGFEFRGLILNDFAGGREGSADQTLASVDSGVAGDEFLFLGYSPESFRRSAGDAQSGAAGGPELDLGLEFGIGLEKIAANCEKCQTIS